ncbi:23S rRNA (uracil(1939)-C(5))-methyltransferase RlmD [Apibacter muscae]|uniref:23S rRNA (Uracil(1939)-C(5))-methyltransferase RlmD n=1 Tax=Apibacter muscae TaxID=2509004 RepID=A0A563DKC3_9FLAO|nr:23S rRNA (uracil(1939)-C(5))-methyltransferase RlmD [Apibacter muscae]TWP30665.1 23S rRNA (uracil(1939)-C(5))-methyltransferase RlmD [Apibacter muscae]
MKKKKNIQILNLKLQTAGAKGVAVGKNVEGKTVFVSGAVPGDVVNAQVIKSKKNYIEAEAVEFLEYSPYRVEPRCQHFGVCGGCKWQNLSYQKQLEFKEEEVMNNLTRIGKIEGFKKVNILPSEEQYFYRNKLEFSFSNSRWLTFNEIKSGEEIEDRNALGFHIPKQWSKVLDIKECYLQKEPSNQIRLFVKELAQKYKMEFYDLKQQLGFLRTLMIRSNSKNELLVFVQFFKENKEKREILLSSIQEKFPEVKTILYAINPKGNDSIYDLSIETFSGEGYLEEEIEGLKFKIGAKSFFQTNYKQAVRLYEITREFADLKGDEIVYDLYTGTGTIAQFISKKAKKVIGVESVPEAIIAAKENVKYNQIENCTFYCGDMKDIFTDEFITENGHADVIITDPPRDGMHKKVVETILNIRAEKIVYVSCNSATQARDLELMKDQYQVVKVQAVDMFPQTHHVESVALLKLKAL